MPDEEEPALSSAEIAVALADLHAALHDLAPPTRTVVEHLEASIDELGQESFATGLGAVDRRLLERAMRAAADVAGRAASTIHGAPHRYNIVSINGAARFIEFETIARGPIEWDLAHLEPEAAPHTRRVFDNELLQRCRIGISALTAARCSQDRHRGPNMIGHARHHLDVLRCAAFEPVSGYPIRYGSSQVPEIAGTLLLPGVV